jgi:hypothetical protein
VQVEGAREERLAMPGAPAHREPLARRGLYAHAERAWESVHGGSAAPVVLERRVVHVETSVFDAPRGRALWAAETATPLPEVEADWVDEFAEAVAERLAKDGLLP